MGTGRVSARCLTAAKGQQSVAVAGARSATGVTSPKVAIGQGAVAVQRRRLSRHPCSRAVTSIDATR